MRLKNEPVRRGELFYAPKPAGAATPKFLTTPDIDNCGWTYNISSFSISHKSSLSYFIRNVRLSLDYHERSPKGRKFTGKVASNVIGVPLPFFMPNLG